MNVGYQREFPCFPSLKGFEGLLLSFKRKIPYWLCIVAIFPGNTCKLRTKSYFKNFHPKNFSRFRYNWNKGVPRICRRTVNMQRTHVEIFVKRRRWWNIPWIYRSKTIINSEILFIFWNTLRENKESSQLSGGNFSQYSRIWSFFQQREIV